MDLEDFAEPEVAVVAALAGLIVSPTVRNAARRGAVAGLSALLKLARPLTATPLGAPLATTDDGVEDLFARPDQDTGTEHAAKPTH